MDAAAKIIGLFSFLSVVFADNVPVLIWSPDRPLSDVPQAPASGGVPQEAFHSHYLTPLLGQAAPVLVAFLQDKLHINDISKYADVYNADSDGGAFKNIKGLMDRHFSLELPEVHDPHQALQSLTLSFPGDVHHVSHHAPDLPPTLDLHPQGQSLTLIVVRLRPVAQAPSEEAALADNDELIGKITRDLEKRSIKYTALYTAEKSLSLQREKRESERGSGRHLLAVPEMDSEGAFYNVSYGKSERLYVYLQSVSVCVRPPFDPMKPPLTSCAFNFTVHKLNASTITATHNNNTVSMNLKMTNIQPKNSSTIYTLSLTLPLRHDQDRWVIESVRVNLTNSSSSSPTVHDMRLVTKGYDHTVPLLYSFHCSSMKWMPHNMSHNPLLYLVLGGFQVQPFNTPSNGFLLSVDCVGWFSTAVWMGLFPVALHIVILMVGFYMLASLTTNDRFDDPKGKPLCINAGD